MICSFPGGGRSALSGRCGLPSVEARILCAGICVVKCYVGIALPAHLLCEIIRKILGKCLEILPGYQNRIRNLLKTHDLQQ